MQIRNLQRGRVCSDCRRFRRSTAPAPSEFRDIAGDLWRRPEERATTPKLPMKTGLFCWALTKGHSGQSMVSCCLPDSPPPGPEAEVQSSSVSVASLPLPASGPEDYSPEGGLVNPNPGTEVRAVVVAADNLGRCGRVVFCLPLGEWRNAEKVTLSCVHLFDPEVPFRGWRLAGQFSVFR